MFHEIGGPAPQGCWPSRVEQALACSWFWCYSAAGRCGCTTSVGAGWRRYLRSEFNADHGNSAKRHQTTDGDPDTVIGGVNLGNLPNYLFFFADGSTDANWQGATKGFVGDVAVDGIQAAERTSGGVPYAGTIYTNDSTLGAWASIVDQNDPSQVSPAQAFGVRDKPAYFGPGNRPEQRVRADQRPFRFSRLRQCLVHVL